MSVLEISVMCYMLSSKEIYFNGGFTFVKCLLDSNSDMAQLNLKLGVRHKLEHEAVLEITYLNATRDNT